MGRPLVANRREQQRRTTETQLRKALQSLLEHSPDKISISAVAREAGLKNPSLVHNSYPDLVKEIQEAAGKGLRDQLLKAKDQLQASLAQCSKLREENDALRQEVDDLASEAESLRREFQVQKAIAGGKVVKLRS